MREIAGEPNAPATNTPATNTPATNTPATNTPATNTPATNAPATNAPAADAGEHAHPVADLAGEASGSVPSPTDRDIRIRRVAVAGAAVVFVVVGLLAATAMGLPLPWTGSGPDYGVAREIPLPSPTTREPVPERVEEVPMPAHLMPRVPVPPGYLDDEGTGDQSGDGAEDGADDESTVPQPNSRVSAPAPVSSGDEPDGSSTTTVPPVSTTTAPVTTLPPVSTTTPPAEKDPEPDGSPEATADTFTISAGQIVELRVLDNDLDPDDGIDAVVLGIVSNPDNAYRFSLADDHFRYRSYPASSAWFVADDNFVYEICDPGGLCDTAQVTIHVTSG